MAKNSLGKKETMAHKTQNALVFLKNLRLVIFSEHMKTLNSVFNERKNQLVKIRHQMVGFTFQYVQTETYSITD